MLKNIVFISLIILTSFSINSQDFTRVHELIAQGQDDIFNIDFDKALVKFREAKSVAPNDLRGHFFESSIYFWKALLTRDKGEYNTFLGLSEKIVDRAEDILDNDEGNLDARFYLGWTYTLRAFIMYYIDQNVLRAASDLKDANKSLTYVVEKNSNYYDAYMGLGVYNFIISLIPRKYQWLTSILGFEGDRELGKKQLVISADKGIYTNTESKFYLTMLSWREENFPLAEDYAKKVIEKYPQSPAIWMVWGLLMAQQDKMPDAITAYEKAIEFNKGKESNIVFRNSFGALGTAYFNMNQFDKSIDYTKKYMSYTTPDDRINHRIYALGVSLELLGKRSEALEYYQRMRTNVSEDNDWEKYWLRKVSERANSPITTVDSLLIVASNNRSVGRINESINDYKILQEKYYNNSNDDIKIQINHGLGQTYFKQNEFNKAIEQFKINLSLKPEREKWLIPEAYFQIGRAYLRLGNKNDANKYFEMAEDIDYDFDFKNSLDRKIKNELAKY